MHVKIIFPFRNPVADPAVVVWAEDLLADVVVGGSLVLVPGVAQNFIGDELIRG